MTTEIVRQDACSCQRQELPVPAGQHLPGCPFWKGEIRPQCPSPKCSLRSKGINGRCSFCGTELPGEAPAPGSEA